jgi:hypothetical protein
MASAQRGVELTAAPWGQRAGAHDDVPEIPAILVHAAQHLEKRSVGRGVKWAQSLILPSLPWT